MLYSSFRPLTAVVLPFAMRQMYMHSFDLANPRMPPGYEDYLEPVKALCDAAGAHHGIAHMTVDEKIVKAGMSQRRPKPHVDGCYMPDKLHRNGVTIGDWGGGEGGWNHTCNNIRQAQLGRMSVIVVSSFPGCRAWEGEFDGEPDSYGDLSHIEHKLGKGKILPENLGYLLSPDCVHESMIMEQDIPRSFLRIALPMEFCYV